MSEAPSGSARYDAPMRVLVVLPTYNEAENITLLLPELLALPVDICVVDDASPDGTGQLAEAWAARDSRVHVIHRAGKLGLGTAYVAGFRFALAHGYDAALTMDADFSHHPRYIPAMLDAARRADLVIGSRYVPGGDCALPVSPSLVEQNGQPGGPHSAQLKTTRLHGRLPPLPRRSVEHGADRHGVLQRLLLPHRDVEPGSGVRLQHRRGPHRLRGPDARAIQNLIH